MGAYFLDSSALVKRYIREVGSDQVRLLTDPGSNHVLYIAAITPVELTSAVVRRLRNVIPAPGLDDLLHRMQRESTSLYRIVELTGAILEDAIQLARRRALRAYDAMQLASVLDVNASRIAVGLDDSEFVCSDRDLIDAALAEGLNVVNPDIAPPD